jgi:hypothetical protein
MRSHQRAADGVVSLAKVHRPEDFAGLTTIYASRYRARLRGLRLLRDVFLTAHPPLLFKEGNMLAQQFINTFADPA